jgi:Fe-S cluster assembly protein SufD
MPLSARRRDVCGVAIDPAMAAIHDAFLACVDAAREPAWLAERRTTAMECFIELGLPARSDEAWRFTDLRPLITVRGLPAPAPEASADPFQLASHRLPGEAHRIVLVNGCVAPDLSNIGALPKGAWFGSVIDMIDLRPDLIKAAFDTSDSFGAQPFASLNAAFFADGFILALEPGVVLLNPVEVLYLGDAASPQAYHLRSAILAGAGSQASVVETYIGNGPGWTNAVTTIDIGPGATLRHVKVQAEGAEAIHIAATWARLDQEARYDSFSMITGARLSRQDIQVTMAGADASLQLNAAYLLRDDQEATIAPTVDHQAPGGRTSELLKGVLADRAHGVFLGSVMVREGADGTDARQLNRNLMTSPTARVDTKPELTIYADEVKCSHGATVGDLDDAALFYLESRGIDPVSARTMLVEAFAIEVLDMAALAPDIDRHTRRYLHAWLEHDGGRR